MWNKMTINTIYTHISMPKTPIVLYGQLPNEPIWSHLGRPAYDTHHSQIPIPSEYPSIHPAIYFFTLLVYTYMYIVKIKIHNMKIHLIICTIR